MTASVDALGKTSFTDYDAAGQVTAMVDANGKTSFTLYDNDGRVTASVDANGHTSFTLYDDIGRTTASVDALGKTSYTDYDAVGQVTATVDALGKTSFTDYDADGRVTASVDANGKTSFMSYDAAGNVTQSIDANGKTTTNSYDADNRLTRFVDGAGRTAQMAYDNDGRTTQTVDVHGYTTLNYYDAVGNSTEVFDAASFASYTSYDAADRPTMSIDGNGHTSYQDYDALGRVTATVDGNGYTSFTKYDAVGQVTATIDGANATTQYQYDGAGNKTAVIDPDGNTTTMAFDAMGRVTQTITPTNGTTTQAYDAVGNLTQTIAADNSSVVTTYDADNRQTQQVWYDASHATVDTQNRTYTNDGLLATASNSNGTYTFSYDNDGRATQVVEPFAATLTYAYDAIGNQTQVVDSFGGTQTSSYDVENRLTSRTYSGQSQTLREDFTYGPMGQVATQKRYSNLAGTTLVGESDYAYDGDQQVTSIIDYDGSANVINNFAYTYDPAGNLATQTENGDYTYFNYDHANQLTLSGFLASGSMTYVYNNYGYDAAGNRNTGGSTPTTGNQLTTDGTWNYTYDAKGNVTEKDSVSTAEKWTYAYNNANELTEAKHYNASSTLVLTADYKYDIFGNRTEKDVTTTGTVTTRYAYDMWNPAKSGSLGASGSDIWAVLNGSSSLTSRQLQGDGVDEHIAYVTSGGSVNWYLADHLGSIRTIVDGTGATVSSYGYDAFGNITSPSSPSMYAWTGRELDAETGLQYNRARYYDSATGRWISLDPMGFDAGDSNLYRYVANDALIVTDASGLQGQLVTFDKKSYSLGYRILSGRPIGMPVHIMAELARNAGFSNVTLTAPGGKAQASIERVTLDRRVNPNMLDILVRGTQASANRNDILVNVVGANGKILGSTTATVIVPKSAGPGEPPNAVIKGVKWWVGRFDFDTQFAQIVKTQGINRGTSPAADYPPQQSRVATSWGRFIPVQVFDQFGDPLGSIYSGADVEEHANNAWQSINQRLDTNGKYSDPLVALQISGQKLFDLTTDQGTKQLAAFIMNNPYLEHAGLFAFGREGDSETNLRVRVGGHELQPFNREFRISLIRAPGKKGLTIEYRYTWNQK